MNIKDLLSKNRDNILEKWIDSILQSYPKDSSVFFKHKKNQFDNPIGTTLKTELPKIVDSLIAVPQPDEIEKSLDEIIRIRAVQEFSPAQAVGFLFSLKTIVRDVLKEQQEHITSGLDLDKVDFKIDQLVLLAFNIFMQRREKMYELRLNALKRETYLFDRLRDKKNIQNMGQVMEDDDAKN